MTTSYNENLLLIKLNYHPVISLYIFFFYWSKFRLIYWVRAGHHSCIEPWIQRGLSSIQTDEVDRRMKTRMTKVSVNLIDKNLNNIL